MIFKRFLLLFFGLVCLSQPLKATHIMGGDLTYKNIGNNKVELKFVLYRDNNATVGLDTYIDYNIYTASNTSNKPTTRRVYLKSKQTVKPELPNCAVSVSANIEQGIYIDTITVGTDTVGYHVVWFRNERNWSAILNLEYGSCNFWSSNYPEKPYGSIWYAFIPPRDLVNSTPQFLTLPIPYLCAGKTNIFNPVVSDADKDSLVFSLEVPYSPFKDCSGSASTPYPPGHKNFSQVVYKNGFNVNYPFGTSDPAISIDSRTGEITATPSTKGAYVIAIQIKEYRYDPLTKKVQYLGLIRRDLQFVVGTCPASTYPPKIDKDTIGYTRYVDPGDTLTFDVTATSADANDTMFIRATGGIFKNYTTITPPYATFTTDTAVKKIKSTFFWTPSCEHITYSSPHLITFIVQDVQCNTLTKVYSIYVRSRPILKPVQLRCAKIFSPNNIQLTWTDTLNTDSVKKSALKYFKIYRRKGLTGKFTLVDSLTNYNAIGWTDTKAFGADTTIYSYFIREQNTCGLEGLPSDTLTTFILKAEVISDKKAKLSWNRPLTILKTKYYVLLDEGSGYKVYDSTYSNVYYISSCSKNFSAQIYIQSDTVCAMYSNKTKWFNFKDNTAPLITNDNLLSVSVLTNKSLSVKFAPSDSLDVYKYYIYRAANGGGFSLIDSVANDDNAVNYTYLDSKVNTLSNQYCYYIKAKDSCGNMSVKTAEHCSILFTGIKGQRSNALNWKPYKGFKADTVLLQTFNGTNWNTKKKFALNDTAYIDSNLNCNEKYYYRIVYKTNNAEIFSISDSIRLIPFDTVKPAEVNILNATVVSNSQIDLSFEKVKDLDVKKYEIYYSKNGGSYSSLKSLNLPLSSPYTYNHTGIDTRKDTFAYKIYASDSCSANLSPTSEIYSPVVLKGVSLNNAADLHWSNFVGFKVKEFVIQYYDKAGWKDLKTINKATFSHIDTNLVCDVNRYYRIKTIEDKAGGEISYSDSIMLTPFDTIRPPQPEINAVTLKGDGTIYLSWKPSPAVDVTMYVVYRKIGSGSYVVKDTLYKLTSYTDTSVNLNQESYIYTIRAIDSCALNISDSATAQNSILLKSKVNGCVQAINLDWTAYSGWPKDVKRYEIYRSKDGGSFSKLINIANNLTTYTDKKINYGHFYSYYIKAIRNVDSSWNSISNIVSDSTFIPLTPELLSASVEETHATNGVVTVKWKSQAGSPHLSHYQLYYKGPSSPSFSLLKDSIPMNVDSFVHKGINTNTKTNQYYILTVDSCGTKSGSSSIHKTSELRITVGQLVHNLYWTAYQGWPVDKYIIEYKSGNNFESVDTVAGTTTKKLRFPMPCSHEVFYRIKAMRADGIFAYSDTTGGKALDTVPANAPTFNNLSIVANNRGKIEFTGADSLDIYGYSIMRQENGGAYQTVGFIKYKNPKEILTFIDSASLNDRYYYTVLTLDSCLNVTASDTFCNINLETTALNQAAKIKWSAFKGFDLSTFDLQRLEAGTWKTIQTLNANNRSFIDTPLACNVNQYYRVIGYEKSGSRITYSDSAVVMPFDTLLPNAITLKNVTTLSGKGNKISWNWDTKSDLKYFEIWRADSTLNYKILTTVKYDSIYLDNTVNPINSEYYYYIIAIDSCDMTHRSMPSDTDKVMKVRLSTVDCVPLIRLKWTKYNELPKKVDSYHIFRSDGVNPVTEIKVVDANTFNYTDSTVLENVLYTYYIQAQDKESGYTSNTDTISMMPWVIPAPKATEIKRISVVKTGKANGSISIEWKKGDLKDIYARGYRLYEQVSDTSSFKMIKEFSSLNDTVYLRQNVNVLDNIHRYYITVYNICSNESIISPIHEAINLTVDNNNLEESLHWNSYKGFDILRYDIEKSENNGTFKVRMSVPGTDTFYVDSNVFCDRKYSYRIKAIGVNGLVTYSDSVFVKSYDTIPPRKADLTLATVLNTDNVMGSIEINFIGAEESNRAGNVIYKNSGKGFVAIDTFYDIKTIPLVYIDHNANTHSTNNAYYFRSFDSCGNISLPSDTHQVILLKATAKNNRNVINWTPYIGFNNYTYKLEKRIFGNSAWDNIGLLNATVDSFEDIHIKCFTKYEYRITAIENLNGLASLSNIDTATAFEVNLPKEPIIVNADVITTDETSGNILLKWHASVSKDVLQYAIYNSTDGLTWQLIGSVPVTDTMFLHSGLNTYRQNYFYKVNAIDSCGNVGLNNTPLHESIVLSASADEESAILKWNKYVGFNVQSYEVYRDGNLIKTLPASTTYFKDINLFCTKMYEYKIRAISDSNGIWANSNTDSTQPFDHVAPASVYLISASVSKANTEVTITWAKSSGFDAAGYEIYRQAPGLATIELIYTTNDPLVTTYTDTHIFGKQEYCYYVRTFDYCGNSSEISNKGCIINLAGKSESLTNSLSWNPYKVWDKNVARYNIYRKLDNNTYTLIATVNAGDLQYTDIDMPNDIIDFCYQVEAVENAGGYEAKSISTEICLHQKPIVWMANSFSPSSSQGLNDVFGPIGTYYNKYEMQIFNRWGQLIYETKDSKPWTGKSNNGGYVSEGVYMYILKVHNLNGGDAIMKGTVTVIR